MIFEQQNQKNISGKKAFFQEKFGKKKLLKKIVEKNNFENLFFQLQVTIPSAHPVQISSRSDYCITLS